MTRGRREVLVAMAGGAAASFAMDVVQGALTRRFERARATDDRDEEVEAIASVVRAIGTLVPALARGGRSEATARVLHYAFGIAFAYAYAVAADRAPVLAAGSGVAFGSGLFLLSDRIVIPVFGLGRTWHAYSQSERANALASHLAYGVVLEVVRTWLVPGTTDDASPR